MPGGPLSSLCQKTRLCRFYREGTCTRGGACKFAHGHGDMRAPPDLRCTRVCPSLIATGRCGDDKCHYAHSKEELRKVNPAACLEQQLGRATGDAQGGAGSAVRMVPESTTEKSLPDMIEEQQPGRATGDAQGGAGSSVRMVPELTTEKSLPNMIEECPTEASLCLSNAESRTETANSVIFSRGTTPDEELDAGSKEVGHGKGGSETDLAGGRTARPRDGRNKFVKTSLCKFHVAGRCTRGSACYFAHNLEERQPLPDLSRTKLCPDLLHKGACRRSRCAYAHRAEELRPKQPVQVHASDHSVSEAASAAQNFEAAAAGGAQAKEEGGVWDRQISGQQPPTQWTRQASEQSSAAPWSRQTSEQSSAAPLARQTSEQPSSLWDRQISGQPSASWPRQISEQSTEPPWSRQTSEQPSAFWARQVSEQPTPPWAKQPTPSWARQTSEQFSTLWSRQVSEQPTSWWARQSSEQPCAPPAGRILVKNTFLSVEEPTQGQPQRRASSAPCRLGRGEVRSSEKPAAAPPRGHHESLYHPRPSESPRRAAAAAAAAGPRSAVSAGAAAPALPRLR